MSGIAGVGSLSLAHRMNDLPDDYSDPAQSSFFISVIFYRSRTFAEIETVAARMIYNGNLDRVLDYSLRARVDMAIISAEQVAASDR
ncbi:MAG: hypothetical protein H7A51_13480 [Akkermansiaceae bacterium]|nr:hypothetical protein [Akkermansiaceae bacterium]